MKGDVSVPGSKSITHRALILAAFTPGSTIINPLRGSDTLATKFCLEQMGAAFEDIDGGWRVTRAASHGSTNLACDNSGTTLRLLTSVCSLFSEPSILMGDDSLNKRPMGPLIVALKQLGADISSDDDHAPIRINKPITGTQCEIRGNISSQYISSLIIAASIRPESMEIRILKPVVSFPYIQLTLQLLEPLGITVRTDEDEHSISYHIGGQLSKSYNFIVPPDSSSAAFFIAAGVLPGNQININWYPQLLLQADTKIIELLLQMGAQITENPTQLSMQPSDLKAVDISLHDAPDIFPILSVIAALTPGEMSITGAHHLKFKESDRIQTTHAFLTLMGAECTALDDGIRISSSSLAGGVEVHSHNDHRIAMAACIAATQCKDKVQVDSIDCVDVSFPSFFQLLQELGVKFEIIG
ncbi:MAG: 3-phosphoshikimate 1-carboxyvinyltransferase [Candidatus Heimdallarchaeota archaeon]|nr:3-phosphoshikimate 1-carboxyvinyltransferase [Candidatus Heimdallarchaeota archaeon]